MNESRSQSSSAVHDYLCITLLLGLLIFGLLTACSNKETRKDIQEPPPPTGYGPIVVSGNSPASAVASIGLATILSKDFYKSPTIGGECKFKNKDMVLPFPCRNSTLILKSIEGAEVSRQQTNENGEFAFAAEPDKRYMIEVPATKNYIGYKTGTLEMGFRVSIQLEQTKKQ